MSDTTASLEREAELFGYYLVKEAPSETAKKLYVRAIQNNPNEIDGQDGRLLKFVRRHRHLIGIVDAGLPFYKEYSEIRRRLYVMLAILESNPLYHDMFLPKKRSPLYAIVTVYCGARAIFKAAFGIIIVRIIAR